jgi:hypothetical protein
MTNTYPYLHNGTELVFHGIPGIILCLNSAFFLDEDNGTQLRVDAFEDLASPKLMLIPSCFILHIPLPIA